MPLVKLTNHDAKNNHGAMTRKGMALVAPNSEKTVDLTDEGLKAAKANPKLTVEELEAPKGKAAS